MDDIAEFRDAIVKSVLDAQRERHSLIMKSVGRNVNLRSQRRQIAETLRCFLLEKPYARTKSLVELLISRKLLNPDFINCDSQSFAKQFGRWRKEFPGILQHGRNSLRQLRYVVRSFLNDCADWEANIDKLADFLFSADIRLISGEKWTHDHIKSFMNDYILDNDSVTTIDEFLSKLKSELHFILSKKGETNGSFVVDCLNNNGSRRRNGQRWSSQSLVQTVRTHGEFLSVETKEGKYKMNDTSEGLTTLTVNIPFEIKKTFKTNAYEKGMKLPEYFCFLVNTKASATAALVEQPMGMRELPAYAETNVLLSRIAELENESHTKQEKINQLEVDLVNKDYDMKLLQEVNLFVKQENEKWSQVALNLSTVR